MKTLIAIFLSLLFAATAIASDVTLAWDANTESDLAGYKLYYGNASGAYQNNVDVGNVTTYTVKDLTDGTWYFVVTAYDTADNESGFSNEVNSELNATPPADPKNVVITVVVKIQVNQ